MGPLAVAGAAAAPEESSMLHGAKLAIKDYRTWCLGTVQLCITNMIGFNFFYPTLIQGLGYKNTITILLLSAPPYICAVIFAFRECTLHFWPRDVSRLFDI